MGNSNFCDSGWSVAKHADSEIILCSTSKSVKENNDIFLAKIEKDGNPIWQKTVDTEDGSDWGSRACLTTDERIIVAGYANSFGTGSFALI